MKKRGDGQIISCNSKPSSCCNIDIIKDDMKSNNNRKNIYERSLSLIFSLWCLIFLFYSRLGHSHENADSKLFSVREASRLEEVVWKFLGNSALECQMSQQLHNTSIPEKEQNSEKASRQAYLGLDEFRNKTMQGKEQEMQYQLGNITHRLEPDGMEYNYASVSKGAKVLAHNKEAKGAINILGKDKDKYLRNPCSVEEKFVVIELSEETLVDAIKIANFEHYSSNFKDFEFSGSLAYPTETWTPLGKFTAANVKQAQRFMLSEPKWVRYLRLKLLSHYGSEFYCTLSLLEVYGIDAIERMLEDLIVESEVKGPNQSSDPISTKEPLSKLQPSSADKEKGVQVQKVDPVKGIEPVEDEQKPHTESTKNAVLKNKVPDPVMEVRQQANGRIPGDTVLKILMQKVRSLEINLSVLQEYIKEVNRRDVDVFPEIDKEISRNALLLEKAISDIKGLMEWKEVKDKETSMLDAWKTDVSSQIDLLVRENAQLRSDVEKVLKDQTNLGNKELAVLAVSFFFACVAVLKLVSERVLMFFGVQSKTDKICRTSRCWVLILVSSSLTTFITLLYN